VREKEKEMEREKRGEKEKEIQIENQLGQNFKEKEKKWERKGKRRRKRKREKKIGCGMTYLGSFPLHFWKGGDWENNPSFCSFPFFFSPLCVFLLPSENPPKLLDFPL
jgi:hypothetical protein